MFSDDVRYFFTALLIVVGGILPIVNPLGSAPLFLQMTHGSVLQFFEQMTTNTIPLVLLAMMFLTLVVANAKITGWVKQQFRRKAPHSDG